MIEAILLVDSGRQSKAEKWKQKENPGVFSSTVYGRLPVTDWTWAASGTNKLLEVKPGGHSSDSHLSGIKMLTLFNSPLRRAIFNL